VKLKPELNCCRRVVLIVMNSLLLKRLDLDLKWALNGLWKCWTVVGLSQTTLG